MKKFETPEVEIEVLCTENITNGEVHDGSIVEGDL